MLDDSFREHRTENGKDGRLVGPVWGSTGTENFTAEELGDSIDSSITVLVVATPALRSLLG